MVVTYWTATYAKSLDERNEYVKTEKLYFNCFSKGHSLKECNSKYRCRVNNCNKNIL